MKNDVTYKGIRNSNVCLVTCDGHELPTKTELRNHSPNGFGWGSDEPQSLQLALAMLCDFLSDEDKALRFYHAFKRDMLSIITANEWTIKSESIVDWTRRKLKEEKYGVQGS